MGTLTRTELETELIAALGERDDVTAARKVIFLNLAQMRIARKHKWEELEEITSGSLTFADDATTDKYQTKPTSTRDVHSFKVLHATDDSVNRKLERITNRQWDEKVPAPQYLDTGVPTIYTEWKERFELWKVPDAAYLYEIKRSIWPTAFTTSSDVASDLDEKDDMIISLAVSWAFLTLRQIDDANLWWRVYRNMMNDAVQEEVERPDLDIKPASEVHARVTGDYWKDPFVKGMRNYR